MGQHQKIILDQNSRLTGTTGSGTKQQNKRTLNDRRVPSIKAVWRSIVTGRRKESRRETNNSSEYIVDTHEEWLWPLVLGVIVLSISDAYMTVLLINNGAIEVNPLMAFLIERNDNLFFLIKIALTSTGMMLLVTLKNFTIFKYINGYHLIALVLSIYICLLRYQLILLDSIT